MYITICKINNQCKLDAWSRVPKAGALGQPRGVRWGGRWEEASGLGNTYVPMTDSCQCMASSVQSFIYVRLFETPWTAANQLPCSSPTPRVCSNSCPLSQGCHPTISSSVVPLSSSPQSLPASGSFPMSQLFTWGGQSIGVTALVTFLPKNTQDWPPLEWTGWISLQSKGLSRVFSNTTVQKHQFFGAQLSL